MSAELAPVTETRVFAANGVVHIQDLTTVDPDLLTIVTATTEPEAVVQRALSTGARALSVAQASIDTTMVEEAFAALTKALGQHIAEASTQVSTAASAVLNDPSHGVAASLHTWKREVDDLLDATFNPDRRGSAFGKLDDILTDAADKQLGMTRRLLNPDSEDGPLGRVLGAVREQVKVVLDAVARLSAQVAADRAATTSTAATLERTAIKGLAFEDQVAEAVTGIAAQNGDVAEAVGRISGSTGGCVGDIVVDLRPSTPTAPDGRYVLECKDRYLTLKSILDELSKAATNRDSDAAIAVFSRPEHSPVPEPLQIFDNRIIVVYDKTNPDPLALRLACVLARWITHRSARSDSDHVDADLVGRLIEDARHALSRRTTIRRAHSTATKKIQEAATQIDELYDDLAELMDRIERAVAP